MLFRSQEVIEASNGPRTVPRIEKRTSRRGPHRRAQNRGGGPKVDISPAHGIGMCIEGPQMRTWERVAKKCVIVAHRPKQSRLPSDRSKTDNTRRMVIQLFAGPSGRAESSWVWWSVAQRSRSGPGTTECESSRSKSEWKWVAGAKGGSLGESEEGRADSRADDPVVED